MAGLASVQSDFQVIAGSIESAKEQRATFETVRVAYLEQHPDADITVLTVELRSFDHQIEQMMALSDELSALESPSA